MSNQIVISSGAKVRSLEGVLTGSAGIVSSVPLGGANGVATLDSSGKVPLSQLPASVVTYLGTWNAATNTPTLANGTGDVGDLYICNVAGTVNFGAGPITFAVGDWVIYNGSQWQKSAGQNGTVTSVAVTSTGNDAISITGSPITTAGTINIGFTGDNTQYVNGAGDLTTFPSLTGFVPYTGATQTLDMGAFDVNARGIKINGTGGLGHADFKHQSGTPTGSASSTTMFADTNGNMAWKNDHNYITTLASNSNTADRTYTFPDANGTIALTSNLTSYVPYSGATTNVNLGSYGLSGNGDFVMGSVKSAGIFAESGAGAAGYLYLKGDSSFGLLSGYNSIFANGFKYGFEAYGGSSLNSKRGYLDFGSLTNNTTRTYTFPNASGTIALTSDIPSLSGYVPYTGATTNVNLGGYNLTGYTLNGNQGLKVEGYGGEGGYLAFKQYAVNNLLGSGYTSISANSTNILSFLFAQSAPYDAKQFKIDVAGLTTNVWRTYTMPNADGTLALTSDIPSLANYVTTNTNQTISGIKTFSNEQLFGNGITLTGGYITYTSGSFNLTLNTNLLTANRNVFLQDKAGTIALTSDLTGGTVTSVGLSSATSGVTIGSSPITTSGTITLAIATASGSQQGLLSSTDWTTFNNKQNALTNPVTGTGTSSYHAKFTGTSTIGNSMLTDDGTTLQSIGATRSNLYLKAASNSYYSQLAFTNGTNGSFGGISYNNTGQYMQFETNSSEWMRLSSSGNLMLNTTSAISSTDILTVNVSAAGNNQIVLRDRSISSYYGSILYRADLGETRITSNDGGVGISFYTNVPATEKMRITPDGKVGIGTSSPDYARLVLAQQTNNTNDYNYLVFDNTATGYGDWNFYKTGSNDLGLGYGTTAGSSYSNAITFKYGGNILMPQVYNNTSGVSANLFIAADGALVRATSSIKYKRDIVDYDKGLDIVKQMRPVYYKGTSEIDGDKQFAGFIAEEINDLGLSEFVQFNDKNEVEGLGYGNITALLVKAIQEQQAQIEELKALINK